MSELKEIDIKILQALLKDGRESFTDIANVCNISKDVVWKHYMDMKKSGIIVGATIQFNYQKFGYSGVAMVLLSVDSQYIAEVYERLSRIPDIVTFRFYNSSHNIAAISMLKSLRDLEHAKEVINKQSKINEIKTYLWTDVRNIPENILATKSSEEMEIANLDCASNNIEAQNDQVKIDEIDLQIVERLTKNGRMPFSKIAKEIGASTDTVSRRYERLRKNNFIKVSIQFNPLELGYQSVLDIEVALNDQSETKEVVEQLSKIPGVAYLVKISGNYDLSVAALVKDCRDIIEINEAITTIPNIKKIEAKLRALLPRWPGPRQYISTF